jgi:DNA-binding GntR family transcriptional regulator
LNVGIVEHLTLSLFRSNMSHCPAPVETSMELTEINRISVADQVASILRQRILDGELPPGTALQEVPMAASLGVSRNTIREATRILSLEGLLKRSAHRGVAVAQLSLEDVSEIYRLRHLLEIPAVRAAKMQDSDVLTEMRKALEGYEQAVEGLDWVRAVRFDLHFHTLLIRFLRNRRLESFYEKLLGELRMGMVLVDLRHDNPGGLVPVHRRIHELLTSGQTEECTALLAQHLRDSETRLTAVMDQRIARAPVK